MHRIELPVDAGTRSLAHWALYLGVALPTALALLVGLVDRLTGHAGGAASEGLLTLILLIGLVQFAIIVIGRAQYFASVRMRTEGRPAPPANDPGIFHHGSS